MSDPLFIRADASAEIGTGHVMRCLALAQAWQERAEGGDLNTEMPEQAQVVFVCACLPEALEQRLKKEGCEVVRIEAEPGSSEDRARTLAIAQEYLPSTINHQPLTPRPWFVLDGYSFDMAYQRAMRAAGFRLLVVDDYNHLPEYECDILLNQNLGADTYDYKVNPEAERLLGPKYALLRWEFRNARAELDARGWTFGMEAAPPETRENATHWELEGRPPCRPGSRGAGPDDAKITPPIAHNILVTMGGADLHGMTGKVVAALSQLPGPPLHIRAVTGAAAGPDESLQKRLISPLHRIEWLQNVEDMPGLMQWADLAISAAGSTCWELMCLGVPMMVVILAANQEQIARQLDNQGLAVNLGWHHFFSETVFIQDVERYMIASPHINAVKGMQQKMADGLGALRVLTAMRAQNLLLRQASMDDAELLWRWVNDPVVRESAFNPHPISWAEHMAWLQQKLDSKKAAIYIACEQSGNKMGQIRFEWNDLGEATVDVSVDAACRGSRIGAAIIRAGCNQLSDRESPARVQAWIKPDNKASIKSFNLAGFSMDGRCNLGGKPALRMSLECAKHKKA